MKSNAFFRRLISPAAAIAVSLAASASVHAAHVPSFATINFDSDILGVAHDTDALCVNPWGLVPGPEGNLHVACNLTGVTALYQPGGALISGSVPHAVTIPAAAVSGTGAIGAPTGEVANNLALLSDSNINDFTLTSGTVSAAAHYLIATEDGLIVGYRAKVSASTAIVGADLSGSGAGFTGLALNWATTGTDGKLHHTLYAANFRQGSISVFDSNFHSVTLSGSAPFVDPGLPSVTGSGTAWSPFNVKHFDFVVKGPKGKPVVQHDLLVAYALHAPLSMNEIDGAGNGFVDLFTSEGVFVKRLVDAHGPLNAPWGIAIAHTPLAHLKAPSVILVGNHGDGQVHAFGFVPAMPALQGAPLGVLRNNEGNPLAIGGLWSLHFGLRKESLAQLLANPGDLTEDTTNLYFSAGIAGETHGLVGRIAIVP